MSTLYVTSVLMKSVRNFASTGGIFLSTFVLGNKRGAGVRVSSRYMVRSFLLDI